MIDAKVITMRLQSDQDPRGSVTLGASGQGAVVVSTCVSRITARVGRVKAGAINKKRINNEELNLV
jgi:hypothetical protein